MTFVLLGTCPLTGPAKFMSGTISNDRTAIILGTQVPPVASPFRTLYYLQRTVLDLATAAAWFPQGAHEGLAAYFPFAVVQEPSGHWFVSVTVQDQGQYVVFYTARDLYKLARPGLRAGFAMSVRPNAPTRFQYELVNVCVSPNGKGFAALGNSATQPANLLITYKTPSNATQTFRYETQIAQRVQAAKLVMSTGGRISAWFESSAQAWWFTKNQGTSWTRHPLDSSINVRLGWQRLQCYLGEVLLSLCPTSGSQLEQVDANGRFSRLNLFVGANETATNLATAFDLESNRMICVSGFDTRNSRTFVQLYVNEITRWRWEDLEMGVFLPDGFGLIARMGSNLYEFAAPLEHQPFWRLAFSPWP